MPVKCPDYVGERRKALDEALELMTQELTNIEGGLGRTINFKHCFLELRENLRRLGFFYGPKDSFNFGLHPDIANYERKANELRERYNRLKKSQPIESEDEQDKSHGRGSGYVLVAHRCHVPHKYSPKTPVYEERKESTTVQFSSDSEEEE